MKRKGNLQSLKVRSAMLKKKNQLSCMSGNKTTGYFSFSFFLTRLLKKKKKLLSRRLERGNKRSTGKVTLCTFENFDSRDLLTIPPRRLIYSRTSESEDYITHTVKEKKIIEFFSERFQVRVI